MAKILIISCNRVDSPYPVYPLGANIVASAVKEKGHEVKLFDIFYESYDKLKELIHDYKPNYIGLSLRNVDNVTYNEPSLFLNQYKNLVDNIKTISNAKIILGGSAYTIFPEQFLEQLNADYGIKGPGEISFPKLIESLENGNPPKERIIKGEIDFSGNNSFYLYREKELANFYLTKGGMLNIFTKRGCPHRCLYCSYPDLEGKRYIYRSPKNVVDEIEYLIKEYSADFIFFTDSVFNDKNKNYLAIIDEIIKRKIKIFWTCYMRPDKFTKEEVEKLKNSGLHSVEWGTDCSTDTTLKAMGKDFDWNTVKESNNLFAEFEIPSSHFIIFGGPAETEKTVEEGIKNLSELKHCVIFGGIGIRIFPHTGIFELAKKEGIIKCEEELFNKEIYYFSNQIKPEWLNDYLLESFKNKTNWFYPFTGFTERNYFLHNSGFRGPLWDLLLKKRRN
ncbi:MAG: lipid biosynthesis B12-binding/radical SAM protein [Brevinematales bacterium]